MNFSKYLRIKSIIASGANVSMSKTVAKNFIKYLKEEIRERKTTPASGPFVVFVKVTNGNPNWVYWDGGTLIRQEFSRNEKSIFRQKDR